MSKQTRRTTIEDVADHAGVGKVTVSYVLNGRSKSARISPATQERVLNSAAELNYRPNALARMLVQQRTDTIAVAFQYATYFAGLSNFSSEVMRGVCSACVDLNVDVMLHTKPTEPGALELSTLMDGRVDGVLMLRDRNDPTLKALASQVFPTVLFFCRGTDPTLPFVDCDNVEGGRLAARHLLDLGHTKLAFLAGPEDSNAASDRLYGFSQELLDAGITLTPAHIFRSRQDASSVDQLLEVIRTGSFPTGVFAWSDDDAVRFITALAGTGVSVPEEISVVGFDSSQACERMTPQLTSIRQPIFEMAYKAAHLLIKLVRQEESGQSQYIFPPRLDERNSTGRAQPSSSPVRLSI
jgi:LacI family transcriptional regulator